MSADEASEEAARARRLRDVLNTADELLARRECPQSPMFVDLRGARIRGGVVVNVHLNSSSGG